MKVIQKSKDKGSLKDLQVLINKNEELINKEIKANFNEFAEDKIIWTSPKEDENYKEYRDNRFLEKVGLKSNEIQEIKLTKFWPARGARWDALATTDTGKIILVEAKANIPELKSSLSATSAKSISLINTSLNETKQFLNINNDVDWTKKYYQYTNRLAHLYFLRETCKKQAFLVNVYFIGDKNVSGPDTKQEWEDALKELKTYLGLSEHHELSKYMTDIFIDVKDMKEN
jgi:hypothetical protein